MKKYKILIGMSLLLFLTACSQPVQTTQIQEDLKALQIVSKKDQDGDGVDDYTDILGSARAQIGVVTEYDTSYYQEGYPPENKGACSDVLWRALEDSGYDFKAMLDEDIQKNKSDYPQEPVLDSNINFRRVQNIRIFLDKNVESLTTEVIPNDFENLKEWQAGDIVTFDQIPGGLWHVAIVSDKRRRDGVPYLVHNHGYGVQENDYLIDWPAEISGHFRWNPLESF